MSAADECDNKMYWKAFSFSFLSQKCESVNFSKIDKTDDKWSMKILLLKQQRDPDPYIEAFSEHSISYLPVLQISPIQEAENIVLDAFNASNISPLGIICTSRHATEIIAKVLSTFPEKHPARNLPYYTVGTSTAAPLRSLIVETTIPNHKLQGIFGEKTGNAANLSILVRDHYNNTKPSSSPSSSSSSSPSSCYIFFCGNTRKDTLPHALLSYNVPFKEIQIYHSIPKTSIAWPLTPPDWLVFFSPLGVRATLESFRRQRQPIHHHSSHPSQSNAINWSLVLPKHAAIGSTTSLCMSSECGISVDVVPTKPNSVELSACIFVWERKHGEKQARASSTVPPKGTWTQILVSLCDVFPLSITSKGWLRLLQAPPKESISETSLTSSSSSSSSS